jgi:hypothetical protein
MRSRLTAVTILGTLLCGSGAGAELPPLAPDVLRADSTHIVTAEVTAVRSTVRARPGPAGFVDTLYTIELSILAIEKGEGPRAGAIVPVRAWQAKARPAGWAGPGGQSFIPVAGERVRAFLRQGDGGALELLLPNGLERLPPGR